MRRVPVAAAVLAALAAGCSAQGRYPAGCAVPPGGWLRPGDAIHGFPGTDRIGLSSGHLDWNGAPVDAATLHRYLGMSAALNPVPYVILEVTPGTGCAAVRRVRDLMRGSPVCTREHRCGEGRGIPDRPAGIG